MYFNEKNKEKTPESILFCLAYDKKEPNLEKAHRNKKYLLRLISISYMNEMHYTKKFVVNIRYQTDQQKNILKY